MKLWFKKYSPRKYPHLVSISAKVIRPVELLQYYKKHGLTGTVVYLPLKQAEVTQKTDPFWTTRSNTINYCTGF